ncbi:MAG: sigma-70 family RNA polymerase sigma factor [Phycisphaerales bacterium]|nr:MAG: sigma-70 family RNA polymerase sigma factor [Phycisphaerales bacterium]
MGAVCVDEVSKDCAARAEQRTGHRASQSNLLGVFSAELGRLKRIAAGMGLSSADCEDVLQDVSVQALKRAAEFQSRADCLRWLTTVTVNRCLMEHRRQRTFRRRAPEILRRRSAAETHPKPIEEWAIAAEELEIVRETLRQLDGHLLAPMVLSYFCELDSRGIAEILNLNQSTVRGRLREARMILARRLTQRGVEP